MTAGTYVHTLLHAAQALSLTSTLVYLQLVHTFIHSSRTENETTARVWSSPPTLNCCKHLPVPLTRVSTYGWSCQEPSSIAVNNALICVQKMKKHSPSRREKFPIQACQCTAYSCRACLDLFEGFFSFFSELPRAASIALQ
jgi:hypothetical protein